MARFVALLRGINVSGHRQIAMADLRRSLQAAGLHDVRTYLQSGNTVFEAGGEDPQAIAGAIQACIAADFGHQVEVIVLPCATMVRIASSNPFVADPDLDDRWFHASFLLSPVSPAAFVALNLPAEPGELAVLSDGVIFLYVPNGYGRSKLINSYFERALGTPATTRNWRTVLALAGLCAGDGEGDAPAHRGDASPVASPPGPGSVA